MGQPTKLDDIRAKKVVDAVKRGLPRSTAARIAGVTKSTLMLWLRKGREGVDGYSDFSDRVRTAEAQAEDQIVATLRGLAATSVPACIFLLSRRNPKAWGEASKAAAEAAKPTEVTSSEERVSLLESLLAAERSAS